MPVYPIGFIGGLGSCHDRLSGTATPDMEIRRDLSSRTVALYPPNGKLWAVIYPPTRRRNPIIAPLDPAELLPLVMGRTVNLELPQSQLRYPWRVSSLAEAPSINIGGKGR